MLIILYKKKILFHQVSIIAIINRIGHKIHKF